MPERLLPISILAESTAQLASCGIQTSRLDAEVLLAHVLGVSRTSLYARLKTPLSQAAAEHFGQLVNRRAGREPLQYITGLQEFWSLEFGVDERVLIPRPETELVVEVALTLLRDTRPLPLRLLDIGTGSGCLAVSLATEIPHAKVWATDISAEALAVAQANASRHGVADRIVFVQTDLWPPRTTNLAGFDLIVSNPPYIARSELSKLSGLQPEVQDWEPRLALDGGPDGLDFYRRLLQDCSRQLCPGGWLVMEISAEQRDAVLRLIASQNTLAQFFCRNDYAGHPRVIGVCRDLNENH